MSYVEQAAQNLSPSVWSYFKSFFMPQTRFKPIDLVNNLNSRKYKCHEQSVVETAWDVTSLPYVYEVLKYMRTEQNEIRKANQHLRVQGFTILGSKLLNLPDKTRVPFPYYNVCEHPQLLGWIIKSAAKKFEESTFPRGYDNEQCEMTYISEYEGLLRFEMAALLRQAAEKYNLPIIIPQEYALDYAQARYDETDLTKIFFIISQKLDVLSAEETVARLKQNADLQRQFALAVIILIQQTGYCDASFDNIRLTSDLKIAILDTEPCGILTVKGKPLGPTVEKHVRTGLFIFANVVKEQNLPIAMQLVKQAQISFNAPSMTKIIITLLSIIVPITFLLSAMYIPGSLIRNQMLIIKPLVGVLTPIVPLVLLVISYIQTQRIRSISKALFK